MSAEKTVWKKKLSQKKIYVTEFEKIAWDIKQKSEMPVLASFNSRCFGPNYDIFDTFLS